MSSIIEDVVKSLVEFEAALDVAKNEASEAKKKLLKDADDWADKARSAAMSKAQQVVSERIAKARSEVEVEAISIEQKGDESLREFEASISKRKGKAVELVVARLLGERS